MGLGWSKNWRPGAFRWLACAAVAAWTTVAAARTQSPPQTTVWDGVYTAEQATAGQTVYTASCAECHGDDLAGREQAPALAGVPFLEKWNRATLRKLYDTVEQMPEDAPKSLTAKQYTDVMAYVLSANEFPTGHTPLPADRGALGDIQILSVKPEKTAP